MEDEMNDHEMMIDHCAMELMDAIEKKDKEAFKEAFHVLVADLMMKMQSNEMDEGE